MYTCTYIYTYITLYNNLKALAVQKTATINTSILLSGWQHCHIAAFEALLLTLMVTPTLTLTAKPIKETKKLKTAINDALADWTCIYDTVNIYFFNVI